MNINKKDLTDALTIVKPGLANKEIIEGATSFAFINGRVITFNDEVSISHPVPNLEITGAVEATQLYALLSKIKKDEVEVLITDTEVQLKAGKAKAGLTLQSEIKLPLDSIAEIGKWKTLPDTFCKYLSFVLGSAGKDMSRPVLTCAHVNQEGWIEASDGLRITKCVIEPMSVSTFLIPVTSCLIVVKLQPIKIAEGQGWIHFKTAEDTILSCRIFEGDSFPDTSKLFKVKGANVTLPKNIEFVLDRASVFAKRDHMLDEFIDIVLEPGKLKIKSTSETGWFEEEMKMEYDGIVVDFSISPYLLKGILSETRSCIISGEKIKFEGENWMYIAALKSK
jgi:hypothetical protein